MLLKRLPLLALFAWYSALACEPGAHIVELVEGKEILCERTIAGRANVFITRSCRGSDCSAARFVESALGKEARTVASRGAQRSHTQCKNHGGKLVTKTAVTGGGEWTLCGFSDGSTVTLGF